MKIEFIKTILLIFLVSLSLLLTLGIWNYQGDYEPSTSETVIDAQLDGVDETKENLIQPSQIIIHDGESAEGFKNKQEELSVFHDITQWALYDFEMVPEGEEMTVEETEMALEVIFPASIPTSVINELFPVDNRVLIDSEFKKIYIYIDEDRQSRQIVFDNINQDGIDVRASIQSIAQVAEYFDQLPISHDLTSVAKMSVNQGQTIYLPDETNIFGRKFRYETINPDTTTFQYIFFRNPSTVATSPNAEGGRVYSDGQREVVVRGYSMEYTNFSTSDNAMDQGSSMEMKGNLKERILTRSIDYINTHDGWLIDQGVQYRLDQLNSISKSVEYRMLYGNYPVFSNDGLASMRVSYQNDNVYQYSRPLLKLTFSYDRAPTILMTGEELVEYLNASDNVDTNEILDIELGYRMEQQQGGQVFDLIPTWCIETYSGWQYVTNEESSIMQGGDQDAVGTD